MSSVTRAIPSPSFPSRPSLLSVALACAAAAGCSSDEEPSEAFIVRSTEHAAATTTERLLADGDWLAYRLSEAGQGAAPGTDFNGDGDFLDSIAVRQNTKTRVSEVLDVAALS